MFPRLFQPLRIECRFETIWKNLLESLGYLFCIAVPATMFTACDWVPRVVSPFNFCLVRNVTLNG